MPDLAPPTAVANALLAESRDRGEILTNLKLQKLLYYSQAWYLALEDTPLFEEDFQAWVHGPVLPSQYFRFRDYQWRHILFEECRPNISNKVDSFLDKIIDIFGCETAVSLELMTHRERPWLDARGDLPLDAVCNNRISKKSMKKFYRQLGKD